MMKDVKIKDRRIMQAKGYQDKTVIIKLRNIGDDFQINQNPNFIRIIEHEYACRYLEILNIETTHQNIQQFLKQQPLKNCDIQAIWSMNGQQPSGLQISQKQGKQSNNNNQGQESQQIISDILQKKVDNTNKKFKLTYPTGSSGETKQNKPEVVQIPQDGYIKDSIQKSKNFEIDYNPTSIKYKYLFPFNQTDQRQQNILLRDEVQGDEEQKQTDKKQIVPLYETNSFQFPFQKIVLEIEQLKEIQQPINITSDQIYQQVRQFVLSFPRFIIPYEKAEGGMNVKQTSKDEYVSILTRESNKIKKIHQDDEQVKFQKNVQTSLRLMEKDVIESFQLIDSQEISKLIGIFSHFAYWMVFGNINPLKINNQTKKQMSVSMYETIQFLNSLAYSNKIWINLIMPLILLQIKMITEYIFKTTYKLFFSQQDASSVALDKIFYLADQFFDPNNLYGRLIFLEADTRENLKKGAALIDHSNMNKRLFNVSPYINILLPNPQDGRSRKILARKNIMDEKYRFNKSPPKKLPIIQEFKESEQRQFSPQADKTYTVMRALSVINKSNNQISESYDQKMCQLIINKLGYPPHSKVNPQKNNTEIYL